MPKDIMWIIAAPSCVGKSTFIESKKAFEITKLPPHLYLQASHYMRGKRFSESHYLHLCMKFKANLIYNEVQKSNFFKKAIILLVPKLIHIKRIESRAINYKNNKAPAPPQGYMKTIEKLSCSGYLDLYNIVFEKLQKMEISYTILRADKLDYPEVTREELPEILWEGL